MIGLVGQCDEIARTVLAGKGCERDLQHAVVRYGEGVRRGLNRLVGLFPLEAEIRPVTGREVWNTLGLPVFCLEDGRAVRFFGVFGGFLRKIKGGIKRLKGEGVREAQQLIVRKAEVKTICRAPEQFGVTSGWLSAGARRRGR